MLSNRLKTEGFLRRVSVSVLGLVLLGALAGCGAGTGAVGAGVSSGSMSLTWTAPSTNVDGSPLNDLSGYKVYYGTSSGSYSTTVDVGNVVTTEIAGLSVGTTYYIVVTAYDTSGIESSFSSEVSKVI